MFPLAIIDALLIFLLLGSLIGLRKKDGAITPQAKTNMALDQLKESQKGY